MTLPNPKESVAPAQKRRVIKLGGSLFDLPNLVDRLLCLVQHWPDMANFVVVGGGPAADMVRNWDDAWGLGEIRRHHLSIFAMNWNAKQIFKHHSAFHTVRNTRSIPENLKFAVVFAEPFLNSQAASSNRNAVPASRHITSDSIAAYVADILHAEQLVMCKSLDCFSNVDRTSVGHQRDFDHHLIDVSSTQQLQSIAERGLVDREFPKYAAKVPVVSWCNFRQWALR